jgi:hypothetical protein
VVWSRKCSARREIFLGILCKRWEMPRSFCNGGDSSILEMVKELVCRWLAEARRSLWVNRQRVVGVEQELIRPAFQFKNPASMRSVFVVYVWTMRWSTTPLY